MATLWELISRFANLFVWWTIVAPWEGAIRVRLGKHVEKLGPGVHFRIPHLDQVFRQTIRMRITTLQLQTLSTRDRKTITICATVGYCITDIAKLYNTLHHAEETIRNMTAGHIAQIVQTREVSECAPAAIETAVMKELDLAQFGLGNVVVKIIDFAMVKTYRLLQDQRWHTSDYLDTSAPSKSATGS